MKGRYPILSDIAIRILSIPATSAASERNWSTFGFIHSKLRNRLHEKRVEKIVYLFWNLRILRALDKPITLDDWIGRVSQNKITDKTAEEIDVESEFSDLDLQLYSDLEEELDKESNEFQD